MAELNDGVKAALKIIVKEGMSDGDPGGLLDVMVDAIAEQAGDRLDGLLQLADYLARPDKLAAPDQFPELASTLKSVHQTRVERSLDPGFEPRSPREALLAIMYVKLGQENLEAQPDFDFIAQLCRIGLMPTRPDTYEWSDEVTQRLTEAIQVIEKVKDTFPPEDMTTDEPPELHSLTEKHPMLDVEIDTVLAMPPDLEASIDIRRRHGIDRSEPVFFDPSRVQMQDADPDPETLPRADLCTCGHQRQVHREAGVGCCHYSLPDTTTCPCTEFTLREAGNGRSA